MIISAKNFCFRQAVVNAKPSQPALRWMTELRRFKQSARVNLVRRFFDRQGGAGSIKGENGVAPPRLPLNRNYVFHVNIDRSFRKSFVRRFQAAIFPSC